MINISNPTNPFIIDWVETPGYANAATVAGNYAFVADAYSGLQVIYIRNLPDPIGSADTPGDAYGVTVGGNYAYVADGSSGGLQIINVSNQDDPDIIGSVYTPGAARGVTVSENYAYVADGSSGGLQVVDIEYRETPSIASSVDTPGDAQDVTVSGNYAYVADGYHGGLQVVDIEHPEAPFITGSVDTPGDAEDVTVAGNYAYVADGDKGLQIINVSNRAVPEIIGSIDTPGRAEGVAIVDDYAYVADGDNGLQIIDISTIRIPAVNSSLATSGIAANMVVVGNYMFIAEYSYGFQIVDISDTENPTIISTLDTPGVVNYVTSLGDYAYVADGSRGFHVYNITNAANPSLIGSVDTPGSATHIEIVGNTAFVTDDDMGLHMIDINKPEDPKIVDWTDTPGSAGGVSVAENYAYIADGDTGLQVIDITTSGLVGAADTPGNAEDVTLVGNYAYVADGDSGLQIVDISTPEAPNIISSVDTPGFSQAVTVVDECAYVADGNGGIQMIDISDPQHPMLITSMATPEFAYDVAYDNNMLFLADGKSLLILPAPVFINKLALGYSESSAEITLSSQKVPGQYNLCIYNDDSVYEIPGTIQWMKTEDYLEQEGKKAIIVAGTTDYPDNSLWESTQLCTRHAYKSLILSQGYTHERITFLSPEKEGVDGDEIPNDIDGEATIDNLSQAISDLATGDTNELLLYITDHGGTGYFHINENETLSAETLDAWLDDLQTVMAGWIIIIYDACNSGSFMPILKGPNRIVITSSLKQEPANFSNYGMLSFSYQFWSSVYSDGYLYRSFDRAREIMENKQTCQIDTDSDGIPDEDKNAKENIMHFRIGIGNILASGQPEIDWITENQTLTDTAEALIRVGDIESETDITRVWAVITPPDTGDASPETPVIDLPVVKLTDDNSDGIYEFTYSQYEELGIYTINVYVTDSMDTTSVPAQTHVTQTCGRGNINKDDRIDLTDAILALKTVAGFEDIQDEIHLCADADRDGRIGIEEAVFILRKISQ